ncbi:MAG: hypothetical protein IPG91_16090 [Ideonella sp.]|nr:hypothetical protein [Ideonella sp.]
MRAGLLYFGCVFAAGFVLGTIRVPLLVPRLGVRWAELAEMPLMLVVIVVAARWVVHRHALGPTTAGRFWAGLLALALLLAAEFGLVLQLQGGTLAGYLESRDPVSGAVYATMLVAFALMPLIVARTTEERSDDA